MVQNVMGSACLKLIDFGDARIVYTNNYIHDYVGNAEFRAPEIIRGQVVSTLTDIWYKYVIYSFLLSIHLYNSVTLISVCEDPIKVLFAMGLFDVHCIGLL